MPTRSLFVVLIAVLISACQEDNECVASGSLAAYFQESELVIINDLIACAANNKDTLANGLEDSVSIFFLPISGASQFSYFETEHAELDPHDHSLYQQVSLADLPVFGGHLNEMTACFTRTLFY